MYIYTIYICTYIYIIGVQKGKRAASMDGREFVALMEHLFLVPDGVSKTFAMDTFTKAKTKGQQYRERIHRATQCNTHLHV